MLAEVVDEEGESAPPTQRAPVTSSESPSVPPTPVRPAVVRRFTRVHLSVVVGLLLVALVGAGWALLRARPVALATVTTSSGSVTAEPTGSTAAPVPTGSPSGSATATPEIVVHVLGAVRKPGVVSLPDRSRVEDAITACGGLTRDADTAELNLAQVLADGQQVIIGNRDEPEGQVRDQSGPGASTTGSSGTTAGPGAPLDLNTATLDQLDTLPGVGPVTAGKIIAWRDAHGRFSRVEELQEVDGIGPKTYAELAPLVKV